MKDKMSSRISNSEAVNFGGSEARPWGGYWIFTLLLFLMPGQLFASPIAQSQKQEPSARAREAAVAAEPTEPGPSSPAQTNTQQEAGAAVESVNVVTAPRYQLVDGKKLFSDPKRFGDSLTSLATNPASKPSLKNLKFDNWAETWGDPRRNTEKEGTGPQARFGFQPPLLSASLPTPVSFNGLDYQTSGGRRMSRPGGTRGPNQLAQGGSASTQGSISRGPELVQFVGPVSQDLDLRKLPYIPPNVENEEERLMRHPLGQNQGVSDPFLAVKVPAQPSAMPATIQNFGGITSATSGCGCLPPDTDGDVGPNHYIQSVNSSIQIFNKTGSSLSGPTTYNSFFSAMGPTTPCGLNQNRGDGIVFYDHIANRWVVSDFAFPAFPGVSFYQCIGVSKTSDPVAGGWWLYALQVDPANPTFLGDYPKFGLWPDAYYMSVNMFSNNTTFNGVRVYALPRSAMINGTGAPNTGAVAFTITPANLGDSYSLVPATFRTGSAPPAGTPEYFLAIDSPAVADVVLTQVKAWRFHVDFVTPANSTFGVGAGHTPDGAVTVNGFVDAFTSTTLLVPQSGTTRLLDTLGDRLMSPLVYQKLGAAESLYVSHTVNNNQGGTGPTAVRWYQFNVTGSTIPATPAQQQSFNNGADGLWRWMPSISVDGQGNMSLGFTASSSTTNPAIKYAGRLAADPVNSLAQGEALLIQGAGHQTDTSGRWGDYSALGIDPSDGCTFWHTNEYFSATSTASWNTRIGSYKFPLCGQPTEGKVKSFTADGFDDGRVLLRWSSTFEVDNLGYNVYREINGKRVRINPQLIAGSALMTAPKVALTSGKSYAWSDQAISNTAGARYWLEDVDITGKSNWAGPILANSDRGKSPNVDESQLLSKIGLSQSQFTLGQGSAAPERQATAQLTPAAMQAQSTLAGESALKISVNKEGWYRIALRDLIAAGLDPNADPRNLQLLVDGQEVPIVVGGQQKTKLDSTDAVEFYGMGLNSSSSDTRVYWLVAGSQPGLRVKTVGAQGGTPVASFPFTVERKERTIYFSALRNGETENFFGPVIGSTSVNQGLRLTNIAPSSGQQSATLEVAVQGVSQVAHAVKVYFNGADVGTINFSGQARGTTSIQLPQSSLREGDNVVTLVAAGGASDVSLTDAVRMTYSRSYAADSNQLRFTASGGQQVTLAGFTSAGVRVIDVTDPSAVTEVTGISKLAKGGGMTVTIPGAGQRALLAFAPEQARGAAEIKANIPSSWRQPDQSADYVVVTRRDLMASLDPLVTQRRNQGLSAAVVDIEDVYDEFSFGNKSPQALKDFLAYAKDNWQQAPRFVVLAGDGTFDPKGYLGVTDTNLLPAKLIDTQFMETASDDWFVDFNNDGLPEISIGRLPVRNASESARLVAKILGYESSTPTNSVLLVSDSSDGYDFAAANNQLRAFIPVGASVSEIRRGTADDATIKKQLLSAISSGQKIVNYDGHGSVNQWRGNILTNDDASALTNGQSLPLFVVMDCLNAYFIDPVLDSLGERLLRAENGGASAVWASAGQTEPAGQSLMNEEFYRQLFGGTAVTIGEAATKAKAAVTNTDIRRTWVLLGDPAMRLK